VRLERSAVRDLGELKVRMKGSRTALSPADELLIRDFEKRFRVELPEDYQTFLKEIPGGHPQLSVIRVAGAPWEINRFYPLTRGERPTTDLVSAMQEWSEVLGRGYVPFANDGGGNQFVLAVGQKPAPVYIVIHDEDFRQVKLANSFAEFVDALEEVPDDEL